MTRQDLDSVRNLDRRIITLESQIRAIRLLAENLVPVLDGMPHATDIKSRVEAIALKTIMAEGELAALREEFLQAKVKLTSQILDEVEDPTNQTLLILRFVELKTWTQVAQLMHVDRRWLFRRYKKFATSCH